MKKQLHFYKMIMADGFLLIIANLFAYLLRFNFNPSIEEWHQFYSVIFWMIPLKVIIYYKYGLYKGMWRYTVGDDIYKIVESSLVSFLIICALMLFLYHWKSFSRAVFVIDISISIIFIMGLRFLIRYKYYKKIFFKYKLTKPISFKNRKYTILLLSPDFRADYIDQLFKQKEHDYNIVGAVISNDFWTEPAIFDLPVVGLYSELQEVLETRPVSDVLLALSEDESQKRTEVSEICRKYGVFCISVNDIL